MIEKREFYIDGAWVKPRAGTDHKVINPSNEEPCAVISLGGQADTDAAVAAARTAFPAWMRTSKAERIALVEKLYEIYESRIEEMAQAISLEMGAPIDLARQAQAAAGLGHLKAFLKVAKDFDFIEPLGDHAPQDRIVHEAIGVVAMITPLSLIHI